jgi:hypothetical protein
VLGQPEARYFKTRQRAEDGTYQLTSQVTGEPDSETFYNPYIGPSPTILEASGASTYDSTDETFTNFDDGNQERRQPLLPC